MQATATPASNEICTPATRGGADAITAGGQRCFLRNAGQIAWRGPTRVQRGRLRIHFASSHSVVLHPVVECPRRNKGRWRPFPAPQRAGPHTISTTLVLSHAAVVPQRAGETEWWKISTQLVRAHATDRVTPHASTARSSTGASHPTTAHDYGHGVPFPQPVDSRCACALRHRHRQLALARTRCPRRAPSSPSQQIATTFPSLKPNPPSAPRCTVARPDCAASSPRCLR